MALPTTELETTCSPLSHPLRVRILDVANERDISPVQFFRDEATRLGLESKKVANVSYHFRELERAGCLEIVDEIKRRGSVEHVYRGRARVYFTDAQFAKLSQEERRALSRVSFQGIIARVDAALSAETMDARDDRHMSWRATEVDERGWDEAMTSLAACFGELEQIRHDAEDRLAASGEPSVPMTFAMLGFESPPTPGPSPR